MPSFAKLQVPECGFVESDCSSMTTDFKLAALWFNIGALIIRMAFWGQLYHDDNKEPHHSIGNY